jgi:hypothetical protein
MCGRRTVESSRRRFFVAVARPGDASRSRFHDSDREFGRGATALSFTSDEVEPGTHALKLVYMGWMVV